MTTIAGGSNMTGRRDGEGKEAFFSNDFDVIYMRSSCCLLIADRGNRMIREIQLPRVGGSCPGNSGSKLGGYLLQLCFLHALCSLLLLSGCL